MQIPPDLRFLRPALFILLGALFLRYGFSLALPFLAGLFLAWAAEPAVGFLCRRMSLRRGAGSAIGVSATLLLLTGVGLLLCSGVFRGLQWLASVAPDLEATALQGMTALQDWLLSLAQRAPEGLRNLAVRAVLGLFDGSGSWLSQMVSALPALAAGLLAHLTGGFLGVGTAILSAYLISPRLPRLKTWFRQRIPQKWQDRYRPELVRLRHAVGGWLNAQARLMGITWLLVWAGLSLLGIRYAPLWAAMTALVDAVPMLGTGIVLIPWSLISFLQQDIPRAIGMLGIFITATLVRSVLEPRLVGKQLGLDPLATLIALYLGYRLLGLPGLIAAPLLAVAAVQLMGTSPESQ